MLNWRIAAEAADGPFAAAGRAVPPKNGPLHIVCDLPKGRLKNVTAILPLAAAADEKIFMNGYQTWTHCPEYGVRGRIRGLRGIPKPLVKRYGLDR